MPIYAYRCEACGHTKDVLQKVSDAPLSICPSCQQSAFKKQLTAAGFQLKGTGWYVTDFRGGANKPAASGTTEAAPANSSADAATSSASAPSTPAKSEPNAA